MYSAEVQGESAYCPSGGTAHSSSGGSARGGSGGSACDPRQGSVDFVCGTKRQPLDKKGLVERLSRTRVTDMPSTCGFMQVHLMQSTGTLFHRLGFRG